MNVIAMISLRNLLRQKRRNLLLGTAIALGVMILIVANSFSNGITDILLNKIVVRVAGHMQAAFNEKGSITRQIFRDRERMMSLIRDNVDGIREVEESIGVFARVIGNGKADNLIIVGVDIGQTLSEETRKEIEESFKMLEGDFADLSKEDIENPAIISETKARYLNVKKGDTMRVRYTNIYGNDDTARATVVGIMSSDNVFMQGVMFSGLGNLKKLMAYKPYEVGNINITIKNPRKNAVLLADRLHAAMEPGLAGIYGSALSKGERLSVTALGIKNDVESVKVIEDHIEIIKGVRADLFKKDSVFIAEGAAKKLGLSIGDDFEVEHMGKFEGRISKNKYEVSAVFKGKDTGDKDLILIGEKKFYEAYYENLPDEIIKNPAASIPQKGEPIYGVLSKEWELLERTTTTDDLQKKIKDISRGKWKGTTVDVRTMYESASDVLKLENVLNIITVSAVFILFVIILIGIVNTLRMAIRERTREIGTVRAIGMQMDEVRNTFILESLFLSIFASAAGLLLAFIVMHLLSGMTFEMRDNPMSILLVNSHLYFKPTALGIAGNIIFILGIVVATAYFPARRASKLSPSAALRHYE